MTFVQQVSASDREFSGGWKTASYSSLFSQSNLTSIFFNFFFLQIVVSI